MIDRRFIFFPDKELKETPAHWGLTFEEVRFQASDGVKLHGWFVPGKGDITWIWFHGNAGNISHRLERLMLLHGHLGVSFFLFDYRGYGRSEGRPSEKGTYYDARGALDYVLSRPDAKVQKIVYFGKSLGSAVAVWLATQRQPDGLVLESPFASVKEMAKRAFPRLPLHLLVGNKYNSLSRIGEVFSPLLIVHGEEDDVVPIAQGRKIYDAAREPKSFCPIPTAGHTDTYIMGKDRYFQAMGDFVTSLRRKAD